MSFQALLHLRQRLHRRRRRFALVIGVALVTTALTWAVLVEGTLLRYLVAAVIGARLDARCTIDEFAWNGWNRAEIRGLSIRVRDWPDEASEVISIGQMSADFDPLPLLWGSLALTDIAVDRMTIRAVERDDGRELNILALQLPATGASSHRPPRINISNLALHVGVIEKDTGRLRFEGRQDLGGSVTSDPSVRGQWHLQLSQKNPEGGPAATLEGRLSGDRFDYAVTLRNLELDESLQRLLPAGIRDVWNDMRIRGRIDAVTLEGDRDDPVREARLKVSDVMVTLPNLGMEEIWARFSDERILPDRGSPRIKVSSGEMVFQDWKLVLRELRGELTSSDESVPVVPLPVSVSLWIDLDRGRTREWNRLVSRELVESALEHAPFGLHLLVENFTMRPVDGVPPTLELPRMAAEILGNFRVRQGRVSIEAFVERRDPHWRGGAPTDAEPLEGPIASEISVRGSLFINEGEGAYFKFPYLLSDVQAHITFTDDQVQVEQLRGRGSGNSEILVTGSVIQPGDDAGVDLRIMTARAPIDEALEKALVESPAQRFLKLLFCRPAFQSLRDAGLPDLEVEAMRARRDAVAATAGSVPRPAPERRPELGDSIMRLAGAEPARGSGDRSDDSGAGESPPGDEASRRLAAALRRLAAVDWLAGFQPGGWCALDLRVRRDVAGGDMVETTGRITLLEAQALCEPLPYPIRVLGRDTVGAAAATILVEDERIVLPEGGLRIELPGGGSGSIRGWIDLPRISGNDRMVTPHLMVRTKGDSINPLLLAAIPADNPSGPLQGPSDGWPGKRRSEAATMIESIGLEGELASTIEIGGDGRGGITWNVGLELSDGTATPGESMGANVADAGLEWPSGFDLRSCRARVFVDEREARLAEFEGFDDGGGRVRASGRLDLETLDRSLSVDFENIGIREYLVNLMAPSERQRMREEWRRHEPDGAFDATLRWSSDDDGNEKRALTVRPRWLSFTTVPPDAQPPIPRRCVFVRTRSGELELLGSTATARDLQLEVEEQGLAASALSFDGTLRTAADRAAPALRARWRGADLASTLLLEVLDRQRADGAVSLWESLRPSGRFDAEFERGPFEPGGEPPFHASVRLARVNATVNGVATTVEVEPSSAPLEIRPPFLVLPDFAAATPNGRFACSGMVPLTAQPAPEPLRVAFSGARLGKEEIALLGESAREAIEVIELQCGGPVRLDDGEVTFAAIDGELVPGFRGIVSLTQASFRAGVAFTEFDGRVDLDVPPQGGADIRIESPSFRVMNRPVRDAESRVVVSPNATRVTIAPLTGTLAGGSASARGVVNIDLESAGGGDYEVALSLVGAQLAEVPMHPPSGEGLPARPPPRQDGRVDASAMIGGPLRFPAQRRGRGQVEIRDGRMAELPITLGLIQVTQLMLPLNTSLNSGDIRFHIDGHRLAFERFDLTCPTLQFRGTGDIDLRDDALALRFRTRGTVPLWSDVFAALSDTIYAIDVTGTITAPRVSLAPLPAFNRAPSMQARREPGP